MLCIRRHQVVPVSGGLSKPFSPSLSVLPDFCSGYGWLAAELDFLELGQRARATRDSKMKALNVEKRGKKTPLKNWSFF